VLPRRIFAARGRKGKKRNVNADGK